MAHVVYSARAARSLERIFDFYAKDDAVHAGRVLEVIHHAVGTPSYHPYIGRPAEEGLLELIISYGRTGFVALYDYDARAVSGRRMPEDPLQAPGRIHIRAIRHQREAGY